MRFIAHDEKAMTVAVARGELRIPVVEWVGWWVGKWVDAWVNWWVGGWLAG